MVEETSPIHEAASPVHVPCESNEISSSTSTSQSLLYDVPPTASPGELFTLISQIQTMVEQLADTDTEAYARYQATLNALQHAWVTHPDRHRTGTSVRSGASDTESLASSDVTGAFRALPQVYEALIATETPNQLLARITQIQMAMEGREETTCDEAERMQLQAELTYLQRRWLDHPDRKRQRGTNQPSPEKRNVASDCPETFTTMSPVFRFTPSTLSHQDFGDGSDAGSTHQDYTPPMHSPQLHSNITSPCEDTPSLTEAAAEDGDGELILDQDIQPNPVQRPVEFCPPTQHTRAAKSFSRMSYADLEHRIQELTLHVQDGHDVDMGVLNHLSQLYLSHPDRPKGRRHRLSQAGRSCGKMHGRQIAKSDLGGYCAYKSGVSSEYSWTSSIEEEVDQFLRTGATPGPCPSSRHAPLPHIPSTLSIPAPMTHQPQAGTPPPIPEEDAALRYPWARRRVSEMRAPPGPLGLRMSKSAPLTVLEILPDSPAAEWEAQGKLVPGSVLLSLDGRDAAVFSITEFGAWARDSANRDRVLQFKLPFEQPTEPAKTWGGWMESVVSYAKNAVVDVVEAADEALAELDEIEGKSSATQPLDWYEWA